MADYRGKKKKKKSRFKFVSGPLEDEDKALVEKERRPLARTLFSLTPPFFSRKNRRKVKAWRGLVQEETGLAKDLDSREKAIERLRDIDVEIKAERIERRLKLKEVQTKDRLHPREAKLAEKELDAREAELDKRIKQANESAEDSEIKRHRRHLELSEAKSDISHEHRMKEIRKKDEQERERQELKEKQVRDKIKSLLKGRDPEDLRGTEKTAYLNLKDELDDLRVDY